MGEARGTGNQERRGKRVSGRREGDGRAGEVRGTAKRDGQARELLGNGSVGETKKTWACVPSCRSKLESGFAPRRINKKKVLTRYENWSRAPPR